MSTQTVGPIFSRLQEIFIPGLYAALAPQQSQQGRFSAAAER